MDGIKVKVFDIRNGMRVYDNIKIIRIISKDYNLLIMKDYLPIIGEIEGSVDIKNDVVNEFRRIFFITRGYVIDDGIGNVFQVFVAIPQAIKFGYEKLALFGYIGFHNADKFAIISFIAEVCRSKSVHGSIVDVRTLRGNIYH